MEFYAVCPDKGNISCPIPSRTTLLDAIIALVQEDVAISRLSMQDTHFCFGGWRVIEIMIADIDTGWNVIGTSTLYGHVWERVGPNTIAIDLAT